MSETLSLSGQEFIPATIAGKHFGYTGDYISKLAREGQVEGTKIGNQWFVTNASVQAFVEHKTIEKTEHYARVREARKRELVEYATKNEEAHAEKSRTHRMSALIQTLVILILGLSVGASGYIIRTTPLPQNASLASTSFSGLERLAVMVYTFVSGEKKTAPAINTFTVPTADLAATPAYATTTHTSLVVAPEEVFTTTTIESVRDSFSDEVSVSVDPLHPDTGIIVPHFKEKDGEAYRFLMVPVNESEN